jgi:hypothetical protein
MNHDILRKCDKEGRPLVFGKETRVEYHLLPKETTFPNIEQLSCELQLTALGVWEALDFRIDPKIYNQNKLEIQDWWRPFQPKEGIVNDRDSILVYGPKESNPWDPCGLAQMAAKLGSKPREDSMGFPTLAKEKLTCMHEVFDYFEPLGRTFLVKLNAGGHYPPHRDHITLTRPTFRLIAFLDDGNSSAEHLRWEVEDKLVHFIPNTLYYVDTRKTHRLWSSSANSTMLVLNVIKNWNNVLKVMSRLRYR